MIKISMNAKEAQFKIGKILRFYKMEFFKAIAIWMDKVRLRAGTLEMVQSSYPNILNPSILRKKQKSTPGRLTSRTGKLKFMLTEGITGTNFGSKYTGTTIYKWIGAGIAIRIRVAQHGISQTFIGEIRVEITSHGRLFSRGDRSVKEKRMPLETSRSLAMRFNWDRSGIKGGGKRPFLTPAAHKEFMNLTSLADTRLKLITNILRR